MSETVTQVSENTKQIVRSRTCGLKDFYIALVQSNTATAYTAGTPVKLARAIKAKIDEKWTSEKIYSDDNTEEVITSYEGTDVELEINALAPQDRVILFGQLYEKGFLKKSSTTEHRRSLSDGEKENSTENMSSSGFMSESLQRVSARRQALKRENCHLQPRASRAVSTSVASTICMRYLLMNPTL